MAKKDLTQAKVGKKDEFYTQLGDIEKELVHYREYFRDKVVFCNCDDPYESNFFKYFALNFNALGLKKLIATCYDGSPIAQQELPLFEEAETEPKRKAYKVEISEVPDLDGNGSTDLTDVQLLLKSSNHNVKAELKQNGSFDSPECIELLQQADIVVTNPPFSKFRDFLSLLVKYNKEFIIIGNVNAISYKESFSLIKDNKMWLGASIHSGDREFRIPDDYPMTATGQRIDENGIKDIRVKGVRWFTNIDYPQRHEDLILIKHYTPEEYPKYDNYDAINVNTTNDIPCDYDGVMGVPITFLDKYSPDQFEIITLGVGEDNFTPTKKYGKFRNPETGEYCSDKRDFLLYIRDTNGKYLTEEGYRVTKLYARVLIRNKKPQIS